MRTFDPASKPSRALALLEQHPRGMRSAEIAAALGVESKQVTSIMSGAVGRGEVVACDVTDAAGCKSREYRLAAGAGKVAQANPRAFSLHRRTAGNPILARPPEVFRAAEAMAKPAKGDFDGAPVTPLTAVAGKPGDGRDQATDRPRGGAGKWIELRIDQDARLTIEFEDGRLEFEACQVLALGDFLAGTEGVWRP